MLCYLCSSPDKLTRITLVVPLMQCALGLGIQRIIAVGDAELIIKQVRGGEGGMAEVGGGWGGVGGMGAVMGGDEGGVLMGEVQWGRWNGRNMMWH